MLKEHKPITLQEQALSEIYMHRTKKKYSKSKMEKLIGATNGIYGKIESGKVYLKVDMLESIAKALGLVVRINFYEKRD